MVVGQQKVWYLQPDVAEVYLALVASGDRVGFFTVVLEYFVFKEAIS